MTTKFYNEDIKLKYLSEFENDKTKHVNEFAFKKAKRTEEEFNKDIFEMNIDELAHLLAAMSASTDDSAYNYLFRFEYYIDWASKNGYRKTNINPFSQLENRREWAKQFVAIRKQNLFTRSEILDMCDFMVNYQDKALLLAIFEGIGGEGFSEILNLMSRDLKRIDDKYYATLKNNKKELRTIEISGELYNFLIETDRADKYYSNNGDAIDIKSQASLFLDSPFIFKKMARGANKEGNLDAFFVRRKFVKFKEWFNLKYLTAQDVKNSGIMHMVNEIYEKTGTLNKVELEKVAEQYDISYKVNTNGLMERNLGAIKRRVNEKIFEDKYGYNINALV